MTVSSSRAPRTSESPLEPVRSTTSAVAAAVVDSARSERVAPATIPISRTIASEVALTPSSEPAAKASRTPSTVAPTCWSPRANVR